MITLKTSRDIEAMRKAGKIASAARALAGQLVKPGISTNAIDRAVYEFISSHGAVPSFLRYDDFPKSTCISLNEEVIHGIPGNRKIKDGDIVSIDVGAFIGGFHGDCASSYIAGNASSERKRLIDVTRQCFFEGIKYAYAGKRITDISSAIQSFAENAGYSVVREYVGHGVGTKLHEEPEVPNFGKPGHGVRLLAGMTLAIEPMINMGKAEIKILPDKWTVVTADKKPSAHYENTVLITTGEPEILTPLNGDGWVL